MAVELTSSQRALLRSRARSMPAGVIVGKGGAGESVLNHVRVQLARRELVKLRWLDTAAEQPRAAAERLAQQFGAAVVDVVGRVVVLYKPGDHLPPQKRLKLPRR